MNNGIIYKITSPSNRVYIGQTTNPKLRINHYRNGHCVKQKRLKAFFDKYGYDAHVFEILEHCEILELNNRERYYQDFYDVLSKSGLNIRLTHTNDKNGHLSQTSKDRISKLNSGCNNGMFGRPVTEKMKAIQREKLSGAKNYLSKWIINTETGIYYECLREASDTINIDKRLLWMHITKLKKNKTRFIYA